MWESTTSAAIHVHAVALAVAAAGICWAALVAGLSRWHWFYRIGALCAPLVLLLPIRAYEPLVLLCPVVLALAGTAALLRGSWERQLSVRQGKPLQTTRLRWRWSLRDSMLVITVFGVALGVLVQLPWRGLNIFWPGLAFDGLLLYLMCVFALGVIGLRFGLVWVVALFVAVSTGIILESTLGDGLRAAYLIGVSGPQHLNWPPLAEFYLVFTALLLIGLWLVRWCWSVADRPVQLAQRYRLVGSLAAITAAPAVVLYMAMFVGPQPVVTPKIRNNSLPQFVAVLQEIEKLGLGDMSLEEVRRTHPQQQFDQAIEGYYQQALRIVKQPGSVSLEGSLQVNEHSLSVQEKQLSLIRMLARKWSKEADYSMRHGDVRRAVDFDLGILRVGNYLARGGIRMHVQASHALKLDGLTHLSMLRDRLPADLLPAVLDVLQLLDMGDEDPELTLLRDHYWTDVAQGWRNRLEMVVQRVLHVPNSEITALQALKQPLLRETTLRRLLGTDLALRSYRQDTGAYPPSLAELVPQRLRSLPTDPYSQQLLIYRPDQQHFVLYSTGPDTKDDGGKFSRFGEHPTVTGYDWNLESLLRFGWRGNGRGPGPSRPGFGPGGPRQPGTWASPGRDGGRRFDRPGYIRREREREEKQ
ncbi:hypothetical protein [Anatilimnocola floriformis]|uniref:hypothetical protein n=1 Tax=Anatilimnocola floriformis TaxID=2948575 RepID=UPI0020C1EFA8|nr:hypothetical protein [Anatilimnocola floriformis]